MEGAVLTAPSILLGDVLGKASVMTLFAVLIVTLEFFFADSIRSIQVACGGHKHDYGDNNSVDLHIHQHSLSSTFQEITLLSHLSNKLSGPLFSALDKS